MIVSAAALALPTPRGKPDDVSSTAEWPVLMVATGLASGLLGATTSLNGVLPAILLTRRGLSSLAFRGEMALFLVVANIVTLTALAAAGLSVESVGWLSLLVWTIVALAFNLLGNLVSDRLAQPIFRRITLIVIAASGIGAIVSALA